MAQQHDSDERTTATSAAARERRQRRSLPPAASLLMHPLTLLVCTLLVRLLCYRYRDVFEQHTTRQAPLGYPSLRHLLATTTTTAAGGGGAYYGSEGSTIAPLHSLRFALVAPSLEANTWRELLYWRRTLHDEASDHRAVAASSSSSLTTTTPYHLLALAPWYVAAVPLSLLRLLHGRVRAVTLLSVCDAVTAVLVAQWPSCHAALLYGMLVCNPVVVFACVSESLTSLELLLMTVAIDCVRRRGGVVGGGARVVVRRGALTLLSVLAVSLLGNEFVALAMAALFPVGMRSRRGACAVAMLLLLTTGVLALVYMHATSAVAMHTSLYAPPGLTATWYARQVVLPAFARLFELVHVQLPAAMTIILAFATPSSRSMMARGKTTTTTSSSSSTARIQAMRDVVAPLFDNAAVMVMLFALLLSLYARHHVTLPCVCVAVLLLYSAVNPAAYKTVCVRRRREGREDAVVTRSPQTRVRVGVPLFCLLMLLPMQCVLYHGWVVCNTVNANSMLFCQVATMLMFALFIAVWYSEVAADAVDLEEVYEDTHKRKASDERNNSNGSGGSSTSSATTTRTRA